MALRLPRADKLRLMQALWSDLTQVEEQFESPAWHETALKETERRVAAGEEAIVGWEEAKRRLRDPG